MDSISNSLRSRDITGSVRKNLEMTELHPRHRRTGWKAFFVALLMIPGASGQAKPYKTAVPITFESRGADKQAIEALLGTYTKAVSTKDQTLFETLLLNKEIPFSGVPLSITTDTGGSRTSNYEDFCKAVFKGAPFDQHFERVHIEQDGPLAHVSLVFVNTLENEVSWGWKTIQLVKIGGGWRIAAEFFTGHD